MREDVAPADHLLGEHLREVLGLPEIVIGLGVRPLDPNGKPTLQLFAGDGTPAGYAKVGWSPATRAMAATEAEAAAAIGEPGPLRVPRVLHHGAWRDLVVTVTAPLPLGVRGHADPDTLPDPAALLAVAESPGARVYRFDESLFLRHLRDEIAAMDDEPRLSTSMSGVLESLVRRYGDLKLRVGRWHGDWVPWNVGHHRTSDGTDELHVWDWEHSAPDVPVGLDLLHWRFQVALVLRGAPLDSAVAAVEAAAQNDLTPLGVAPEARELLSRLYLLEMFVRTYRLKRGGGGWNPALYPAMLDVLARWEHAETT
ncbi:hypothetical protein [Actinomadura rudentiformis]|uniref:Phosphotransferase n=1 Tax=Actinomadura rudentiformis TaxID=359158 RepID=A0A6H9YSJ9_9ACTN|nr:hypothetical protein [Actinomadura rudentiformis]KAB2344029.1 hypothetical protein F8566_32365 [Actinomadura rudentiformis]